MIDLRGKHALVTGGNRGIGSAVANAYIESGATVTVFDIAETISSDLHPQIDYQHIDMTQFDRLQEQIQNVLDRHKKIDILYNNAAAFDLAPFLESDLEMYDKLFNLNVKSLFFTMQLVAKSMVDNEIKGRIINLSSQAGRRGEALVSHYCATKAAVISYTQSAALALAPKQITVNAISPGVIDTPMWQQVDALFAKYENLPIGEKKKQVGQAVPLGRMGKPDDIIGAVLFLSSDQSAYITGQTLNIDGGSVLS